MIWVKSFRGNGLTDWGVFHRTALDLPRSNFPRSMRVAAGFLLLSLVPTTSAVASHGHAKDVLQYGEGLIVNIPVPEPEVEQVVAEVAQNTIIRGTKEYNKDEYVEGAVVATSTPVFPADRKSVV